MFIYICDMVAFRLTEFFNKITLVFALMLFSFLSVGQSEKDSCNIVVKGKLIDAETLKPIPYALVAIPNTSKGTYSEADGSYRLTGLCAEENKLVISCAGYADTVCNHQHNSSHVHSSTIKLSVSPYAINEVLVSVDHEKNRNTESLATETVDKEEISKDPTRSVAAILSDIEGVSFVANGSNVELPIIHGLYGNRVLILNNGFKHGFQNWGSDHAPEIDISSVNKITLVKGAAGIQFGSEALGGVIITEPNPLYLDRALELNIGSNYQSNGRGFKESFFLGKGLKKSAFYLGGSYTKIGDKHTPDYYLTNSGREEIGLNAGWRLHISDWDIKTHYSFVDQNLGLLRASVAESGNLLIQSILADQPLIIKPFSYEIDEPNQVTQHHMLSSELNLWYNDSSKLTLKVGQQINNRKEFDVRRNAELPIIDLSLYTTDAQLSWKHPQKFGLNGVIGAQFFYQDNNNNPGTGTTPFIPNYNTTRLSSFILEKYDFEHSVFEFGIRADFEQNYARGRETNQDLFFSDYRFNNLTSSIGYIHKGHGKLLYRSNIGIAWRPPNMAELFSFGQRGFKNQFGLLRYYTDDSGTLKTDKVVNLKDAGIKAEQGVKWINEFNYEGKKSKAKLTAHVNYINNFIYERPIGIYSTIRGAMPFYVFEQADALLAGTEFTYQYAVSQHLETVFGGSYLYSYNIKKDEFLIHQPPINLNAKFKIKTNNFWVISKSYFELHSLYTFKQYFAPRTESLESISDGSFEFSSGDEIFDFKDAPDGFFLLNAAYNMSISSFDIRVEVRNLMNQRYRNYLNQNRYFSDETGRNILLSINYKLNKL